MRILLTLFGLLICFYVHAQTIKFSELDPATTLGGTEIVPGVQSGANRKISINQIKTFVWDLSPTIATSDTIGFVLVRRTSDGKVFKRHVSSLPGYQTVEDEGTPLTQRPNLNFTGPGVSVTDTGGKTTVEINATGVGGGGSSILDMETSTVGNITTGEDTLYFYTLPADSLNENGDILRGRISGFVANNANLKSIVLAFGGTDIMSRNTTTPTIGQGFTIDWEVIRTGATTQKANVTFSGSDGVASSYYSVPGETLSGTVDIVLTGEATATDDIVKETSYVYLGVGGGGGVTGLNAADFIASETPTGDVDGVNDTYTLANTPTFLHVYLDGLLQEEGGGNDYTISGTTLTMNTPPSIGQKVRVSYIK